jgi:hypothetical protein
MIKSIIPLLLILSMIVFALTSCTNKDGVTKTLQINRLDLTTNKKNLF